MVVWLLISRWIMGCCDTVLLCWGLGCFVVGGWLSGYVFG